MTKTTRRSFLGSSAALTVGLPYLASGQTSSSAISKKKPSAKTNPLAGIERENVTITDVKVTLLSFKLPKDQQWVSATFLVPKTDAFLVEVFTDQGVVGIGESSPYRGMERMKKYVEEIIKPNIVGKNPFDVELLTASEEAAWAGVDVALWDIIGKVKNQPVYQLLASGETDPHIRMYASGGVQYAWYDNPEQLLDEALMHKEKGYTAFKYRLGTDWKSDNITVDKFVPLLEKLRQAVGEDFDLMQEHNMRLTLEENLEMAPALEANNILWLEEPLKQNDPDAIEKHLLLKQKLDRVMISGGENFTTRTGFKPYIDRNAFDIVQNDVNQTGLTEGWYIAHMAQLSDKYCVPHNWHGGLTTMANAHLVAAIPNRLMLELNQTYNPFKEEIFQDPLVVKDGYLDVPDRPGFGMELIDDVEKKYPYFEGGWAITNPNLSN
ncbi:MAG: mandelate racemase/muconate lactonizing enzyme family protein [Bacteroidota bacterium]